MFDELKSPRSKMQVAQLIPIYLFYIIEIFGSALIVKVAKDVTLDNLFYLNETLTIPGVLTSSLCSVECNKHTAGNVNFRSYEPEFDMCKCFVASDEFRDSRAIASDMEGVQYLVDCEFSDS